MHQKNRKKATIILDKFGVALNFPPALTVLGIGASVVLRRLGFRRIGFRSQFAGPVVFALLIFIVNP